MQGLRDSGSSLLATDLRELMRAAHLSQRLEHIGPHQPAPIQLFQILEREEFVQSVKYSSFLFLPFPSLEYSKYLKESLCFLPEVTAKGAGHRCPPLENGYVAEDPKGQKVVSVGLSCRSGLRMANTRGASQTVGRGEPQTALRGKTPHLYPQRCRTTR